MLEIWKEISEFNKYEVSNLGRVRNKLTNQLIKPFDNRGYLRVSLSCQNIRFKRLVHRLVAETFIGSAPYPDAQVNHIDLNRQNNKVENLEWSSCKENINHSLNMKPENRLRLASAMSNIGKQYAHLGVESCKKPVAQISVTTGKVLNEFSCAREAAKLTGSSYRHISAVCTGKRKTHNGYVWKFIKESATTIETTSKDGRE